MVSQSWDGKRVYYTSSLLRNWDKQAPAGPDLQYLKIYDFDGKELKETLAIDFLALKLGRFFASFRLQTLILGGFFASF